MPYILTEGGLPLLQEYGGGAAPDTPATAMWKYVSTLQDVIAVVGAFSSSDPNPGMAGVPWLFADNLLCQMKGSQSIAMVFSDYGGWQSPPMYGTQRFQRVRVDVYADPLRDAANNITVTAGNTMVRCLNAFAVLHRHLQRRDSDTQVWGDLVTYSCQLLSEPQPAQIPDGDSQGMGVILASAVYGLSTSGWTDFYS